MLLRLLEFDKRLETCLAQSTVDVLECVGSRATWYIVNKLATLGFPSPRHDGLFRSRTDAEVQPRVVAQHAPVL